MKIAMNTNLLQAINEIVYIATVTGAINKEKIYRVVASSIAALKYKVDLTNVGDLSALPGIGPKVLQNIKEYLTNGEITESRVTMASAEFAALRDFNKILGVGPKTAEKWVNAEILSIIDLRKAVSRNEIKLNTTQKWGLKYYEDLKDRIPRNEVAIVADYFKNLILCAAPGALFKIAGSFRRKCETSGDIDIIISHKDPKILFALSDTLESNKSVTIISRGAERVTFLYISPISNKIRQIDILHIKRASFYAALLYFTGSALFNTGMRLYAKNAGFKLNQNGLYKGLDKDATICEVKSEKDIFVALGVHYVKPENRIIWDPAPI